MNYTVQTRGRDYFARPVQAGGRTSAGYGRTVLHDLVRPFRWNPSPVDSAEKRNG